jgi:hypothetical protein
MSGMQLTGCLLGGTARLQALRWAKIVGGSAGAKPLPIADAQLRVAERDREQEA